VGATAAGCVGSTGDGATGPSTLEHAASTTTTTAIRLRIFHLLG
jgi:hypothetical protein